MTIPITFASASPRHNLPFLFVAQAQKEFFINEALTRLDALVQASVEGEANDPPATAQDGECWIIGSAPTGDWQGHAGELACFAGDGWLFAAPTQGMRVFDNTRGAEARYDNGWNRAAPVAAPSGGSVEDAEARAAISGLIAALIAGGILSGI